MEWSLFRALANGEKLPVKEKLEYPMRESNVGLSPGILRVIHQQLGGRPGIQANVADVSKRWIGFGMGAQSLNDILAQAQMTGAQVVDWDKLVAVMATTIGGQNLTDVMAIICEVLTLQPEGTEPRINYQSWLSLYSYVGVQILRNISQQKVQETDGCLSPVARDNGGSIGPKDVANSPCRLQ